MSEIVINFIIIVVLLVIALVMAYILARRDYNVPEELEIDPFSINFLLDGVKAAFDDIINKNISELNLNKYESDKREQSKVDIKNALRNCGHGDIGSKEFIIDYIKDILQRSLQVNETTVDNIITFGTDQLSVQDKFDIILQRYKSMYKYNALTKMIKNYNLDELKDGEYQISKEEIDHVFMTEKENINLTFSDKLDIVSRRIYQLYRGLSVVDEIRDMNIDGLSGGIAGVPADYYSYDMEWLDTIHDEQLSTFDSVFIFFQGKTIRLSFLSFGTQQELVRTCKNIYRYGNPGQLSESRGYVINDSRDGARIAVFRPPLSSSWAFFVRKHDSVEKIDLNVLLKDKGKEKIILLVKTFIKAKLSIIITGEMGSGKTTFLKGVIGIFEKTMRIRVYEQVYELYVNKLFPKKNILSLRQIDSVKTEDALNIIKKTDGNVTIIGEIASHEEANWAMEINQTNPEVSLATGHMKTTDDCINYLSDAKMIVGKYNDAKRAERKAVEFLNIDIHYENDNGHRYIERITEVVPVEDEEYPKELADSAREFFRRTTNYKTYKTVDILVFENGMYVIKNRLSKRALEKIEKNLSIPERCEFENLFDSTEGGINNE